MAREAPQLQDGSLYQELTPMNLLAVRLRLVLRKPSRREVPLRSKKIAVASKSRVRCAASLGTETVLRSFQKLIQAAPAGLSRQAKTSLQQTRATVS